MPSQGLRRELVQHHPSHTPKIRVLANPVAVAHFARPADFDLAGARLAVGLGPTDLVLGFMALGDFARKGLGLLIEALAQLPHERRQHLRLLVIGGRSGEIAEYEALASRHGVRAQLRFVGLQKDVRSFLWTCDAFAFPSAYEIFSLAILQAAAAGLPVLVSKGLYGAEEFVADGHNGWVVERNVAALVAWYERLLEQRVALAGMGRAALNSVQRYDAEVFRTRWAELIGELLAENS